MTQMYVPGSDDRKIEKIPKMIADCVCLDCEDGVALNKKEQVLQSGSKMRPCKLTDSR